MKKPYNLPLSLLAALAICRPLDCPRGGSASDSVSVWSKFGRDCDLSLSKVGWGVGCVGIILRDRGHIHDASTLQFGRDCDLSLSRMGLV
jgi:hypothetical protein